MNILTFQKVSRFPYETASALLVIALASVFVLTNITFGFYLSLFLGTMVVSGVLAFLYPRAGLLAGVVLTVLFERFFTLQSLAWGREAYKLYPLDILLLAVLISVLLRMLAGWLKWRWKKPDIFLILFFGLATGWLVASMLGWVSGSVETAFSTWKNYVFYGLLYFLVPLLFSGKEQLRRFGSVFLGAAAIATIFVWIGLMRGEGLWTEYTPLSTSGVRILAFPHAFYFSMAFLITLFAWKELSRRGNTAGRMLLMYALPVWMMGIVGSLMRHLWLGLVLAVGVLFVVVPRSYRMNILALARNTLVFLLVFSIVFFYVLTLFPHSDTASDVTQTGSVFVERLTSIGNTEDSSLAWRGAVWKSALETFSQHMLIGTGFGVKVPVDMGDYRDFVEMRNMHNSWLALMIQTGIVGMVVFVLFLATLAWSVWRQSIAREGVQIFSYATLAILVFHSAIFLSQPYLETNLLGIFFWLNLGVMRTLLDISSQKV